MFWREENEKCFLLARIVFIKLQYTGSVVETFVFI